jgi:chemotaxis regulatin CheY-phosphate phosphatase CheZ
MQSDMSDLDDVRILRHEFLELFDRIQTIRQEIASIRKPGDCQDRFATMSDELDAIVEATESATNSIMENAEAIDEVILALRPSVTDPDVAKRLDAVPDHIGGIFEACSFQDITGQRITKVVNTLQYIESRVNNLITAWGERALSSVDPEDEKTALAPDDERRLLNGPQLKGKGVSQSDVDRLMGNQPAGDATEPSSTQPSPAATPDTPSPAAQTSQPPDSKGSETAKAPPPPPKPDTKKNDTKKDDKGDGDPGGGMDQGDIDKLFG